MTKENPWVEAQLLKVATEPELKVHLEALAFQQDKDHQDPNEEASLLQPMVDQLLEAESKEFKVQCMAGQMVQSRTKSKKFEVNSTCKKMRSTTSKPDSSKFKLEMK
jgi:hypothetical protein